jgi:quinol monooxygenase YgiN
LVFFEGNKSRGKELENFFKINTTNQKEPGNIEYVLHRLNYNPDELLFDEIWIDKEYQEHFKTIHRRSRFEHRAFVS